ncbi:PAS domain-containing protein [Kineococcus radiotolerans]|uniref:PAS domain-containing protein n=1 Tax=Kineococcus radiotolerans TaxID=131568 RepID=A0A7W4TQH3_KINRA|nr:PAS domain-containing protein [Kineococcus radiotolerans]MBB2903202.1 PAS domain-containing protein [Kineococcus radiotolerans]
MGTPETEQRRQARARGVRDAVYEMWGDDMPPTTDPTLSIFTDAVLIDDERGRDQGLLVQSDGLTHEVLLQLLREAGPSFWQLLPPALTAWLTTRSADISLRTLELTEPAPGDRVSDDHAPGDHAPSNHVPANQTPADVASTPPGNAPPPSALSSSLADGTLLHPGAGAWELDHRSRRLSWDEQCAALLDVHPTDGAALEDQLAHHVHPEDRERIADALSRAFDTRQRYEARYRTRMSDGSYAWRLSSGRVIDSGSEGGPRIVGVIAALPS